MTLAHDYRAKLHAEHVARRMRQDVVSVQALDDARALIANLKYKLISSEARAADAERTIELLRIDIASLTERVKSAEAGAALSWRLIAADVCRKHGCSLAQILSPQRAHWLVVVRHELFFRLSTETTMSLPQIGRAIGGRDHTTVLHGIRMHRKRNGLPQGRILSASRAKRYVT